MPKQYLFLLLDLFSTFLKLFVRQLGFCFKWNCKIKYLDTDLKEDNQLQQIYQSNKKALKKNISDINMEHSPQNLHKIMF